LGLLVKQEDCDLPLFDTTVEHARAALNLLFLELM
jgi:aspartate/glutamate racemase